MSMTNLTPITYTPQIISSQMISDLNTDQSQQAQLEEELATGDLVNSPSDNPAAAASLMSLNSNIARTQQYQTNASDGMSWLQVGTSTLNQVLSTLESAQQAVQGLSGDALSGQQSAITGVATVLNSDRQQLISLANTTYAGQAIFSGTGNVSQAYDSNGNYIGGGNAPTRTVGPGVSIAVAATGPSVFGSGSTDLLGPNGILAQVAQDVTTGTSASLQAAETTGLSSIQSAIQQVTAAAAQLGANYQQMQAFSTQATSTLTTLQQQVSSTDSVNIAQASTQLTQDQDSYQAALWATSKIEDQSLVQYLG
jgi:flagellar hook-associated protein 3 FlgL